MNRKRPNLCEPAQWAAKQAFTLIELLVVIAVIGLLAAMLLPVLSKAKVQARSTACKNHLSQIGRAIAMYVSDYTRYPPCWGGDGVLQMWPEKLHPYAPLDWTNKAWHCPTYIANNGIVEYKKPPVGGGKYVARTSYAYNALGMFGLMFGVAGGNDLGLGPFPHSTRREHEVAAPSEMYVVADARAFKFRFLEGPVGHAAMKPWNGPGEGEAEIPAPHSQSYNLLFGDSHVALVKRNDYLYPPRTANRWNRDNQPHPEFWAPKSMWPVQN